MVSNIQVFSSGENFLDSLWKNSKNLKTANLGLKLLKLHLLYGNN